MTQRRNRDDGSVLIDRPDGSRVLLDATMVQYLASEAPVPNQQQLDEMLSRARRVLVAMDVPHADRLDRELLLDVRNPTEIASLSSTLRIVEEPGGHCMCTGNPHLLFLGEQDTQLAEISVHHGIRIRWDVWRDDAALRDEGALLEWLANRGVREPLDEYHDETALDESEIAAWQRWHDATPDCLRALLAPYGEMTGQVVFVPRPASTIRERRRGLIAPHTMPNDHFVAVVTAFDRQYPDARLQARVLFEWLGHGGGVWTGYPVYEQVPEYLLLRIASHDLIRGLDESGKSEAIMEGAARFFAGSTFATYRGDELKRIPERLRRLLRESAARSTDKDRLERARAAFG